MMLNVAIQEKVFAARGTTNVVLRNLAFSVDDAQIVAIYGPSGCGKTTLLRIIAGLDNDYTGHVQLGNTRVDSATPAIGLVSQRPVAYEWLRVRDNIAFGTRYMRNGARPSQPAKEAEKLGALVGLTGTDLEKYPGEISGGMSQRMAFARALLAQPTVLLLDEPFSSLDFDSRNDLQDAVLRARSQLGTSFILVSHDPEEVLYLADTVIVLQGGPAEVARQFAPTLPGAGTPEMRYTTEFQHAKRDLRGSTMRAAPK